MITAICEVLAFFRYRGNPSFTHMIAVACPIFDNKQIKVYRDNRWQLVPFSDGVRDKVSTLLAGWVFNWDIEIQTKELEYPSTVTCGDSAHEIVHDIVKTLLNSLLCEKISQ